MDNKEIKGVTLPIGTVLKQHYIIDRVIGMGGFGITYLVHNKDGEQRYAVKELFVNGVVTRGSDELTVTAEEDKQNIYKHSVERFMEEAKILKTLNQENNVVKITDYFYENNTAYFVMEYIKGLTIKQYMNQNGKFDFELASSIILKVGGALQRIYEKYSFFHRDISPENIMLTEYGEPVLIDFGTAKAHIRNGDQVHSIVLKPGFAPPEQYTGKNQGPWTDIYSLAGTFYYMVTGIKVPPAPDRLMDKTYEPLCNMVPECPEKISEAVDRALELDEKKRTRRMKDFLKPFKKKIDIKGVPLLIVGEECWRMPLDELMIIGRNGGMNNIGAGTEKRISSQHVAILYISEDDSFQVTDISTNGVFYNGKRLEKGATYSIPKDSVLVLGEDLSRIKLEVKE